MKEKTKFDEFQKELDTSRTSKARKFIFLPIAAGIFFGACYSIIDNTRPIGLILCAVIVIIFYLIWWQKKYLKTHFNIDQMQKKAEEKITEHQNQKARLKGRDVTQKMQHETEIEKLEEKIEFYKQVPERTFKQYFETMKWI